MMTLDKQIELLERSRQSMHQVIDDWYDRMIECLLTGKSDLQSGFTPHSLGESPLIFKGTKPVSITFSDGNTVNVNSWRRVAKILLCDCNSDPTRHQALLDLRNLVSGRSRWVLSDSPDGMDVPLKVDNDLYFEAKFDTEYLLKMMTEQIFDRVGYQYSDIQIQTRYHEQEIVPAEEELTNMSMQM